MANVLRSMLSISGATALSRVTGYARTFVQAAVIGTGGRVAEAYTYSNTLPNQVYELFMGGLLSSIFIPLLIERLTHHGEDDARRLTSALVTLIVPFLCVVALFGILFASPLINAVTEWKGSPKLSPEEAKRTTELAVLLFRVFALQILFYGIGALAMGILNSHRRFLLPALAPVLNNLLVIASFGAYALLVSTRTETAIYVLAFGTTLGVGLMSLVLLPAVWRLGYRPHLVYDHPSLLPAVRLAGPMFVFVAASVGVQAAANYFGSIFSGVSDLWYAFTIFSLPYGVFVVAIATALMPELAERFTLGDTDGYRDTLSFGLRTMTFIVVPASIGMITLSQPIIGLLYEHGRFTSKDTAAVAAILTAYGVGLLGYAAYFILVRSFYSRQNTRIPAALNIVLLVLYVVLGYALSRTFGMGLPGVALGFSAAYAILSVALLAAMRREIKKINGRQLITSLAKILVAGAIMYAVASGGILLLGTGTNTLDRLLILVLTGGVSLAAYLAAALLLRTEELSSAVELFRSRSVKGARKES